MLYITVLRPEQLKKYTIDIVEPQGGTEDEKRENEPWFVFVENAKQKENNDEYNWKWKDGSK